MEQGKLKLKLDDTIGMYVPDRRPGMGNTVTIHQLLNHSSGIVDYANFPRFWENRLGAKVSRAEFIEIMNRDLEFAPGSAGKYNSSGYYLLGSKAASGRVDGSMTLTWWPAAARSLASSHPIKPAPMMATRRQPPCGLLRTE